jgi:two-component system, response regulator
MMVKSKSLLLVAEDDPDDQFLIQDVIDRVSLVDIEARFVENGVDLIACLEEKNEKSNPPQLVMLDLNMPLMDGREALRRIKNNPSLSGIPIVILTTSRAEEDVQYCRRFGVAAYYNKPSSIAELKQIIRDLVDKYFE